jgi:hypothetical protein
MANNIKITSSLEATVNDSKTVSTKSYTIKEVDKNIGNSGGSYTQEYLTDDAVKYVGVVSATSFTAIASAFESVTTSGTAPAKAKALYVSHDSEIGTAGTVDVEIGAGFTCARLATGESCIVPLSETDGNGRAIANLRIRDTGYVNDSKESTVTAVLVGS